MKLDKTYIITQDKRHTHLFILLSFDQDLNPKTFQPSNHTNGQPWTREYDAHMNFSAIGPASTNLPTRSLALRTSPLVVLLYGPARPSSNTCDPPATYLPARSISQT